MRADFDTHRDVWGPVLAGHLRIWSELVYRPARALRDAGLYPSAELGTPPVPKLTGGGPSISRNYPTLNLLDELPSDYERLRQFDAAAREYQSAVEPFSAPIFDEAMTYLEPHLVDDARVLDPSAGPGREAILMARRLPQGEVIAADLSGPMVRLAWRHAKEAHLDNVAVFQQDAARPPDVFSAYFDVIYCQLSFHYFPDGKSVAEAFQRVLKPGGIALIVDPGPSWFNTLSAPLAALANPAFVQYRTGEEFRDLLLAASFRDVYWTEFLPGMGLAIAVK